MCDIQSSWCVEDQKQFPVTRLYKKKKYVFCYYEHQILCIFESIYKNLFYLLTRVNIIYNPWSLLSTYIYISIYMVKIVYIVVVYIVVGSKY